MPRPPPPPLPPPEKEDYWSLVDTQSVTLFKPAGYFNFYWNPEDGLNTNVDMAYSSKCKTTIFEIQTRDICTLPPWRPYFRKVLLTISSTDLNVRTTSPVSINVGTWKWKKKTTRQHTLRSQYDFVDAKDTETGKKSPGCPEMLNSMLPLLLDESMTGSCHSRIECLWS